MNSSNDYIKITAQDGNQFSGFLCQPPTGKGPGILLIQEIFGVNSHIRDVADLYAQAGFVVLAPDLFWRIEPNVELSYNNKDFAKGLDIAGKLSIEQTLVDLGSAIETLRKLSTVTEKVGTVGYCFGGKLAYCLASDNKVDAAVSYYGGGIDQILDQAKDLNCPLLMHFAELDKYIPDTALAKIRSTLDSKSNVTICEYKGVDHGFNCDQRATYDRKAAMLAFARSVQFLHKHLG